MGGTTTTQTYTYPSTSNRLASITVGGAAVRSFTYDAAGSITGDDRAGTAHAYTINDAGRIARVTIAGSIKANYAYDHRNRLSTRQILNMVPAGTTHSIHDKDDRLLAETNGAGTTVREYVWLREVPIAVLDGSATPATPVLLFVHADHLHRPELMTNAAKTVVWKALYEPFGAVHAITGPAANDQRFPGQWFQLEAGLHYNWWRHYDPSTGRYTQVDPLVVGTPGVGPSLYGYAGSSPHMNVDPEGRAAIIIPPIIAGAVAICVRFPALCRQGAASIARGVIASADRDIWWPDRTKGNWTCKARADCNDNIPGNCPDDLKKRFAFGGGVAPDLGTARNIAKANATSNLQCQPKHVSCRCTSPTGDRYSGGC